MIKAFFQKISVLVLAALLCLAISFSQTTTTMPFITPKPEPVAYAAGDIGDMESVQSAVQVGDGFVVPINMYYQHDPNWEHYKYGGVDSMATHGCGPTALAIIVSSLTDNELIPPDTADWASANGYFSQGSGSVHAIIPDGARNYGLKVELVSSITSESVKYIFSQDKLIVMLMGPGDFTGSGHFLVAHGYDGEGNLYIADPASEENTSKTWPIDTLVSQLSTYAQDAGPVWIVSNPN